MKQLFRPHGYYRIRIQSAAAAPCLRTNGDRAFVVAQLQQLLSPRLVLNEIPAHKQLAACIDLLAFSIRSDGIDCILFSIGTPVCDYFAHALRGQVEQHINDTSPTAQYRPLYSTIKRLRGPHHALSQSVQLHTQHTDWEYDRYSSIGFYLHDRRGDWMRTWRLASLYDNVPEQYRQLITSALAAQFRSLEISLQ